MGSHYCHLLLDAAYEIDHVVALENGGVDCLDTNAQALCRRCHGEETLRDHLQAYRRRRASSSVPAVAHLLPPSPSPSVPAVAHLLPPSPSRASPFARAVRECQDDPFRCYRYV